MLLLRQETESKPEQTSSSGAKDIELSVQSCLESVGISLLCELDLLAFVYRHQLVLSSAEQIARLVGYESGAVVYALDRLEREKLIGRSQPPQSARFYRLLALNDATRQRCLQQLVNLTKTRVGRLLLAKQLKPVAWIRGEEKL